MFIRVVSPEYENQPKKAHVKKKTELKQRSNVIQTDGQLLKILVNQIQYSIKNIKL